MAKRSRVRHPCEGWDWYDARILESTPDVVNTPNGVFGSLFVWGDSEFWNG